jgi:peptide/nickel transport system permease protein
MKPTTTETAAAGPGGSLTALRRARPAGVRQRGRRRMTWTTVRAERAAGVLVLAVAALCSIIIPPLSPYPPDKLVAAPSAPPSGAHWFGTDELGRDLFVRVMSAIRVDLGITVASVLLSLLLGLGIGLAIGLSPRPAAEVLQRCVDAVLAIPYLVFVLAIVAFTRSHQVVAFAPPGVGAIVIALAVTGWPNYARITAVQTRILVRRDSIAATRLLGYSRGRTLVRHVIPEVLGPSVSLAGSHAVLITAAVASLSFLGAGVAPPTPELGAIMQGGTPLIQTAWWISVIPGLVLVVLGAGFSLIADARED